MGETLAFRLHSRRLNYLNYVRSMCHFNSRSELIRLILTETVYNTLVGKYKTKGVLVGETVVIGANVSADLHQIIRYLSCKQRDTVSGWAGIAVIVWLKNFERESEKQRRRDQHLPFSPWQDNFAQQYRLKIEHLQYELSQISCPEPA